MGAAMMAAAMAGGSPGAPGMPGMPGMGSMAPTAPSVPAGPPAPAVPTAPAPAQPGAQLSAAGNAAVDRLVALGFERDAALEVYLACEKNEEMAANILFDA